MKLNLLPKLAGLSLALLLFSCEKDSVLPTDPFNPPPTTPTTPPPVTPPPATPTPPPVTTNSLLTQLGTQVFKYNAQGRLIEVAYTDHEHMGYTVVYEGDKPVRLNFKGSNNYMLYTYEGGKVVEAVRYYGENLVNYRYTFEYSGDKLVKETTMSYARYDAGQLGITEYEYDANGNLAEIIVTWSSSNRIEDLGRPSVIKWGGYDSKPNPKPYAQSTYYLPGVKLFENNPGYRDPGSGKELYSYIYHDSGMPKQRYTKLEAYPHVNAFVESYTYQ